MIAGDFAAKDRPVEASLVEDDPASQAQAQTQARAQAQTQAQAQAQAGVLFTVRDCGAGMAAPTLARIFDPFFTTRGVRGTGLGLAICQSIIHRHGGRIAVESQTGQGTTFRFWLPVTL